MWVIHASFSATITVMENLHLPLLALLATVQGMFMGYFIDRDSLHHEDGSFTFGADDFAEWLQIVLNQSNEKNPIKLRGL
jgi:hypothetical protein